MLPLVRGKIETQARVCEAQGHWAWCAILWRRIGEDHHAIQCENILSSLAINERIKLIEEMKPVVIDIGDRTNGKSL